MQKSFHAQARLDCYFAPFRPTELRPAAAFKEEADQQMPCFGRMGLQVKVQNGSTWIQYELKMVQKCIYIMYKQPGVRWQLFCLT